MEKNRSSYDLILDTFSASCDTPLKFSFGVNVYCFQSDGQYKKTRMKTSIK